MNKKLALAVLIALFLVGDAYGDEDVYYCTETAAVGFMRNKTNDSYIQTTFKVRRFKMKYEGFKITLVSSSDEKYVMSCTSIDFGLGSEAINVHQCTGYNLSIFNWNKETGFFTRSYGASGLSADASIASSYGSCTKF